MKYNIINKNIEISYKISYDITYQSQYNEQLLLVFLYKHLINKYNIILSRYITLKDIKTIKNLFYEDEEYFKEYTKNLTNGVIFLYKKILLYDYISPLFIYYYTFYKNYIFNKNKELNIFDISLTFGLFESCLFSYYNDDNKKIKYYKLQYVESNLNTEIFKNINKGIGEVKKIYKDLKNYDINNNYVDTKFDIENINKIIEEYKIKKINICNTDHVSIRLIFKNNKPLPSIFNHIIQIYIVLNILEEGGKYILTLEYEHYDYLLNIFYILNSLFKLKYPKFIQDRRYLIILKNYKKQKFIENYKKKFDEILNKFEELMEKEELNKITNLFNIEIEEEYKKKFKKIYDKYVNEIRIKQLEKKLYRICDTKKVIELNKKCFYFKEFLELIEILYDKNLIYNVNFCKKFGLELRPDILTDIKKIEIKLKQQLYTMNYDEIYIIDNQKSEMRIKLEDKENKKYNEYVEYINEESNKLKLIKFYIDSKRLDKWNEITTEINIRKSITNYLDKNYEIKNSRAFVKMYDILNLVKLIDFNKKEIKTLHVCEAPGNFINAMNYYIKSNKPEMIYNWKANSLKPIKGAGKQRILGDFFGFIRKYKERWDWLKDDTGDITKLENILYIKEKYRDIELYTSDCGSECTTVEEMLDQENKMILVTYSQILIGLLVNKIGGHMIIKLFLPITRPLSYSLLYLLHNKYERLYFIKQSSGSLGSSEFYIVGYNKLEDLSEEEKEELLKIYDKKDINSNYTLYEELPEYFINKLNNITELFIKEQKKYIKRSFIYYDNKMIYEDHKLKYFKEAKEIYCKEWIKKNNFLKLKEELKL